MSLDSLLSFLGEKIESSVKCENCKLYCLYEVSEFCHLTLSRLYM